MVVALVVAVVVVGREVAVGLVRPWSGKMNLRGGGLLLLLSGLGRRDLG